MQNVKFTFILFRTLQIVIFEIIMLEYQTFQSFQYCVVPVITNGNINQSTAKITTITSVLAVFTSGNILEISIQANVRYDARTPVLFTVTVFGIYVLTSQKKRTHAIFFKGAS